MPQSIVVPVGQCGNQIAARFWDLALQEHSLLDSNSFDSFFHCENSPKSKITLTARTVMIDMEESVIHSQILKSPIAPLFSSNGSQIVTSNSGSGNNWAVGYAHYGPLYSREILDKIRLQAEKCDSLQSFFIIQSLGGGTGSGLGSRVLELVRDAYPKVYSFANGVIPSAADDVVTSPYNSVLALRRWIKSADCVLPVENQALGDLCLDQGHTSTQSGDGGGRAFTESGPKAYGGLCAGNRKNLHFDKMNNIVANLILNITSSMRFEGSMNVDINDIITNLVPFPTNNFLISSMAPLFSTPTHHPTSTSPRTLDQMFTDAFSKDSQLLKLDPARNGVYLACALIVRGKAVEVSDLRRNVDRVRSWLKFVRWNRDGWKTGLCAVAPVGQSHSLLTLSNNSCIYESFETVKTRFLKLYKRKANLHHYLNVIERQEFEDALEDLNGLIQDYKKFGNSVQ